MDKMETIKDFFNQLWKTHRNLYTVSTVVLLIGLMFTYVGYQMDFGSTVVGISFSVFICMGTCVPAITVVKGMTGNFIGIIGALLLGFYLAFYLFDIETAFIVSYAAPLFAVITVVATTNFPKN